MPRYVNRCATLTLCLATGAVEAQTMPIINARELVEGANRQMVIVQTDASGPDGRGGYHGTYSGETATYWSRTWTVISSILFSR